MPIATVGGMKTQGRNFLTTLTLGLWISTAAFAEGKTEIAWVAKISGQKQCRNDAAPPSLARALETLERSEAIVLEAKLGSLSDRMFCDSCSCNMNLFHVAKVNSDHEGLEIAKQDGWEVVDPKTVADPSVPSFVLPIVVAK